MCLACQTPVPAESAEDFSSRFLRMLNDSMLMLLISVGHRARLFDAMAGGEPVTSTELAARTRLSERYLREWLSGLATGGIVLYDPTTSRFTLPEEMATWLSEKGPTNLALFAQYLPVLGGVEDEVLRAFHDGRGVPYSAYGRFQAVMAEESGQSVVPLVLEQVVPLVEGLHLRLQAGIDALDIGCGRGRALMRLAAAYPNSRFTGYDLDLGAVNHARAEANRLGLKNVRFATLDLTTWDEPAAFDWIMAFDAIHDQARPDLVLASIRRALRPNGVFLMQDIDASSRLENNLGHPLGPLFYTISTFHCMSVSLAQGGMGLGTAWGVELAQRMLGEAGFGEVVIHRLPDDIQNAWFVVRPAA